MALKVIHAQPRMTPSPINDNRVDRNPPPLLWPAAKGKNICYAVRLSQDRRFPKRSTFAQEGFCWAMFNPHQKLASGRWHWQYGISKGGRPYRWSDIYTFEITRSARSSETPFADEMMHACPKAHPRLWVLPQEMGHPKHLKRHMKQFTSRADHYLDAPLKDDAMPPDKGKDTYQVFKFHRWGSKALAGDMTMAVQWLIPAYLLSGDERYAREAIRRGLHVAKWDPDGYTNPVISDFADGSCMRLLAGVYDTFYDHLTESERKNIRTAMIIRADRIFHEETNKIETLVFRSHFWQHLLIEFAEAAFALLHEHPDAEKWVQFVYELWVARFPLMGGTDGGWANGNSYFGTNIETLLVLPSRIGKLTGVDLFKNAWYKNSADFLLYTWPPNSRSDGFGDGTELKAHPNTTHLAFAEDMAARFNHAEAAWYVQQWQKKAGEDIDPLLLWHSITNQNTLPRPRAPKALPQAKCFPDVGIASLHTHLADTSQNLMVGMRSSPYGSLLHSHECQNAFNIFYGGEPLFRNSGYYTSAGDDHSKNWYRATRGHNAVLIDGKGQPRGSESYGTMPRFLNGKHIAYALGDASNAYGGAGLLRFRRHLVLLRPNILVIYDDLEADHNANWQWLIHGDRKTVASVRHQRLRTQTRTARSQVNLFGSQKSHIDIHTVFDPPAHNWGGNKTFLGKNMAYFPDQWHVTVSPKSACKVMRFLTVFQICDRQDNTPFQDLVQNDDGIHTDTWSIRANLNPDQKAGLEIYHQHKPIGFAADVPSFVRGTKRYRASQASILVEASTVHRTKDVLPQAAR
jgi:hypothetical protein